MVGAIADCAWKDIVVALIGGRSRMRRRAIMRELLMADKKSFGSEGEQCVTENGNCL